MIWRRWALLLAPDWHAVARQLERALDQLDEVRATDLGGEGALQAARADLIHALELVTGRPGG